jgi:hypothetical protein
MASGAGPQVFREGTLRRVLASVVVALAAVGLALWATAPAAAAPRTIPSACSYTADAGSSRSCAAKFQDSVSVKDFGAVGDGTTNDTTAFASAIAWCDAGGNGSIGNGGCTINIPEGTYKVSSINLSKSTAVFYRQIRLRGAGRWATTIIPSTTGNIIIDMIGRNYAAIEDLAIDSTGFQSQTAIFLGRSTTSTNSNNNKFTNLHIAGNYSKAAVVSIAAESATWYSCRFENSNSSTVSWTSVPSYNPKYVAFYSADDNTQVGITTSNGTISTGPNTDNVMLDPEFYQTADNAVLTYFRNTAGYRFIGGSWIAGTQNGIKLMVLQGVTGNIFNGSMDFVGPHFEWFGTGTAIYLDPNGNNTTFKGLHFFNGFLNSNGGSFIDYDRTSTANQPYLVDATINSVKGNVGAAGFQIYLYALGSSSIHWQPSDDTTGTVTVFSFIADSLVKTWTLTMPGTAVRFQYDEQFASAVPTTGTYFTGQKIWHTAPAPGTPLGWLAYGPVTLGTLNGGATTGTCTISTNTLTVNSATGLVVGQRINIVGIAGPRIVTNISGTAISLLTNCNASVAAAAVSNDATLGGLVPFGTVGNGTSGVGLVSVTQANLGTPGNGTLYYCSDCTTASACTGGGSGALASRQNGAWKCL